jgi:signal transduction histidine kinase
MRLSLPALILAAFTGLAAGSLVVGGKLARRETVERIERDRGSHGQLAIELSAELRRLDVLYESHLRHLLESAASDTGPAFVAACRNVRGVRHFSRLGSTPGPRDLQIDCRWPGMTFVTVPVFASGTVFSGTPRRLDPALFFGSNASQPWVDEPLQPALFFTTTNNEVSILVIDKTEVNAAVAAWMGNWLRGPFANLAAAGGGVDRVANPAKTVVAASGDQPTAPADWVLPVRSQFGTWRIESWDERAIQRSWHAPTLAWAIAGAVSALTIGFVLAARVRSERLLAEQRVSFVNRVSHELRTPLTNMLLNLDIAAEEISDHAASRRINLVREEARRLSRLIENVLTFSRFNRAGSNPDPQIRACDPAAVLESVMEQFTPSFARREIRVRRSIIGLRPCLLDGDALAQVIANLLSNVEKYAPSADVEIQARIEHDHLVVTVADQGPGIPASAAERIFVPFERLDSRLTEGATGTGLGLAIARELTHRMGGTLRLLPVIGSTRGATFELRVPAPAVPGLGSFAA